MFPCWKKSSTRSKQNSKMSCFYLNKILLNPPVSSPPMYNYSSKTVSNVSRTTKKLFGRIFKNNNKRKLKINKMIPMMLKILWISNKKTTKTKILRKNKKMLSISRKMSKIS